jgi:hypothetical protein
MQRGDFMLLLIGAIAASSTETAAQQGDRTRRIGVLMGIGETDPKAKPRREALENGFESHAQAEFSRQHLEMPPGLQ